MLEYNNIIEEAERKLAALEATNELTVGVMSLVAQQEREAISKRTKEALAVAKVRLEAKR